MRATHLKDEEIQQYVLDRNAVDAEVSVHIDSCEQCKEKVKAYRLLVMGLREQPRESFDFSIIDLVMQQLPVAKPRPIKERENALIYAFIAAGVTIIGLAFYFFRKYLAGIFESIAPVFIYLALTAFITLSIFLVIDIYKKYKKKIHTLELYRG